jgi:hypothetical protein
MPGRLSDQMRADFARFKQQADANLQAGAEFLQAEARRTLGRQHPPASKRGEAPARRSGRLQAGQFARANLRSGTIVMRNEAAHARFLRASRPWEDITLARVNAQLAQILTVRGYREALRNG